MTRPLGIDLGTTHTLAAWVDDRSRVQLLEMEGGRPLLASAVRYGKAGVEVGAAARARALAEPQDVVLSSKRLMGRAPSDIGPEDRAQYRFAEGGGVVRFLAGGRAVTPVEVAAEILREVKRRAAAALGGPPGGCAITVPAWFDDAQRQATRDAGKLAGLDVARILNEPTAAALAYGLEMRARGTFAVYDLGGGTFDLSILRLQDGVFEVLATAGDTRLGGDDLDRALAARLLERCGPGAARPSPALLRGAAEVARRAREELSFRDEVAIAEELPGGLRLRQRLRRSELEEILAPILERTAPLCRRALLDAGVGERPVDGVVLVGGATRAPAVRRLVRRLFGQEPFTGVDPETVVAAGAAIQADALARGGRDDALLLDVVPLSLGVEAAGGLVEKLVLRNSTVPLAATQEFTTQADGQTGIVVHVVQGERELARDCRSLARFTLRGIPPLPAGAARVEITYAVDADGILSVSAVEKLTGLSQRIAVRPAGGLEAAEVERMVGEGLAHAGEDAAARWLAEQRVAGERALAVLRPALEEDGDLLAADARRAVDERVAGLAEALAGDDGGAIRAWLSSLEEAALPFVEARMDRCAARALRGRRVEELAAPGRPPEERGPIG